MGILGANQTEDLLVARNEIVSSYYHFYFSYSISPKRVDGFSWNFQGLFGIEIVDPDFWYVTSGRIEIWSIFWFLCRQGFLKTIKYIELKFSAIVDWSYLRLWWEFHRSRSKDIEAHLDSKIEPPFRRIFKNVLHHKFFILNVLKRHIEQKLFSLSSSIERYQKKGLLD